MFALHPHFWNGRYNPFQLLPTIFGCLSGAIKISASSKLVIKTAIAFDVDMYVWQTYWWIKWPSYCPPRELHGVWQSCQPASAAPGLWFVSQSILLFQMVYKFKRIRFSVTLLQVKLKTKSWEVRDVKNVKNVYSEIVLFYYFFQPRLGLCLDGYGHGNSFQHLVLFLTSRSSQCGCAILYITLL